MIVDSQIIEKSFLECDEVIEVPVYFSFGDAENAQGELCPNPVAMDIKGFVSVSPGLTLESAAFSKGNWDLPILDAGSMISDEDLTGTIKINVGDTCSIPGYVSIKWRGYDGDGEVCLEHIMQYDIYAGLTCCQVNKCADRSTTLVCK